MSLGLRFDDVLSAAAGGDRLAFAELWRAHHPMLVRYLKVVCGESADDVASESWVKVIGALGSFRGNEHGFRGWLVVIARNQARDLQRRDARRREVLMGEPIEPLPGPATDCADSADRALENRSTTAALRLVATLPPEQAELVMLRVVFGLDVGDVARITGRTPGSVRVAVHRALKTLAGRISVAVAPSAVTHAEAETLGRRDV